MADGEDRLDEQPKVYENSEDGKNLLIKWLKQNLDYQKRQGIADDELVLNIGYADLESTVEVAINFDFTFSEILLHQEIRSRLSKLEYEYIYSTNCHNVDFIASANFQSVNFINYVDFSEATFKNNATFSEATFREEAYFSSATFDKGINLTLAKFTKKADFGKAKFKNNANFIQAEFTDEANFCLVDFQHKADFRRATFKNNAYFSSAIFEKDIDFSEANFTNNAYFVEAKFIVNAYFSEAFFTNAEFHKACFAGETDFSSACFTEKADFREVNFKKVNFNKAIFGKNDIQKVDFINTTFKNNADFSNATFTEESHFNMTHFNTCKFSRATFKQEANFENAIFEKEAYFGLSRKEHKSNPNPKTTFEQKANFERAIFKGEADFKWVIFTEKANFNFTKFKGEADFKYSSFYYENKKKNDTDTDSNSFLYATFGGRGAFYDITLLGTLYFDKIKMENETSIYFGEIDNQEAKIKIVNTVVNGRIDFREVCIKKIDFTGTVIVGNGVVSTDKLDVKKYGSWKTARFLKHEAIRISNHIEALKFQAAEKDEYKKFINGRCIEIDKDLDKLEQKNKVIVSLIKFLRIIIVAFLIIITANLIAIKEVPIIIIAFLIIIITFPTIIKVGKALKIFFFGEKENDEIDNVSEKERLKTERNKLKAEKDKYWWEDMSIRLSKLSNNHGQNWGQAVLFTILSGWVCFTIFYAPYPLTRFFDCGLWEGYLHSLAEYYIPINYAVLIEYLTYSKLSWLIKICGLLVYLSGKIAVAYGMVEVVQAFRKLK